LLSLTRHIRRAAMYQREHRWPGEMDSWAGVELYGLTMGIVGYGSVGRQIARLAQALGMKILACKRRPEQHADDTFLLPGTGDPEGTIPAAYYGIDRLREMLAQSDVVVITLPGTPHTRELIGVNELAALPRHAWLINVGRGAVIDESSLIQALRDGKLAGAALDVFTQEPLPAESPLWDLDNVLITPHIASWTTNYPRHCAAALIENLRRNSLGLPLINVIDKQLLY
ncbi:MAG: D-2-hydroxyacid dehydrogenase, partial [Planctomycetaceae bacterium]